MISSGPKTLTVVEKKMTVKNHKVVGEPLGHVKEFLKSIWLWPIKIFYSIFFLTRFQSIWKTRTLKTLHGKLSSQASFRCLPRTIKPLLSADCSRWQVLLRHSVWPRGLCRVTNKGGLEGRSCGVCITQGTTQFSFSRFFAHSGSWPWRTLIASSTWSRSLPCRSPGISPVF